MTPTELWHPRAIRVPGHMNPRFAGFAENSCLGLTFHSMEGTLAVALRMVQQADTYKWTFSNARNGQLYQHYPINVATAHSGSEVGNLTTDGMEHEGFAWEPLTGAQVSTGRDVANWMDRVCNWQGLDGRLFLHHQWSATACPSGRVNLADYTQIPVNAEFVLPVAEVPPSESFRANPEEDEVQLARLDQGKSIKLIDALNKSAGAWIADNGTLGASIVTAGAPPNGVNVPVLIYVPPQYMNEIGG